MPDHQDATDALRQLLEDGRDVPVAGTREVADLLDVSRPTATSLLDQAAAAGAVSSTSVGGSRVWTLSGAFTDQFTGPKTGANTVPETGAVTAPDTFTEAKTDPPPDAGGGSADRLVLEEAARDRLRGELPTQGKSEDDVEDMLNAVQAAADLVRRRGEAGASDLQAALYSDHAGPYSSEVSWYKRMVRPGLQVLADDDLLQELRPPGGAGQPWRWG